jgi:chorismate mutase
VRVLALRGATTCDENTKDEVDTKTQRLVEAMLERNAIGHDDLVSIIFTATDDITAEFPATASSSDAATSVIAPSCFARARRLSSWSKPATS